MALNELSKTLREKAKEAEKLVESEIRALVKAAVEPKLNDIIESCVKNLCYEVSCATVFAADGQTISISISLKPRG